MPHSDPLERREYQRQYRKKYRKTAKGADAHRQQMKRTSRRQYANGYYKRRTLECKLRAFAALGGVCKRCGFGDIRALQIDHIDGGGNAESKDRSYLYYKRVAGAGAGRYQLLCANCNWIKRYENNENGKRYPMAAKILPLFDTA